MPEPEPNPRPGASGQPVVFTDGAGGVHPNAISYGVNPLYPTWATLLVIDITATISQPGDVPVVVTRQYPVIAEFSLVPSPGRNTFVPVAPVKSTVPTMPNPIPPVAR